MECDDASASVQQLSSKDETEDESETNQLTSDSSSASEPCAENLQETTDVVNMLVNSVSSQSNSETNPQNAPGKAKRLEAMDVNKLINNPVDSTATEDTTVDKVKSHVKADGGDNDDDYGLSFQSCAKMSEADVASTSAKLPPTISLVNYQDSSSSEESGSEEEEESDHVSSDDDTQILAFSSEDENESSTKDKKKSNNNAADSLLSDYYAELRIGEVEITLPDNVALTRIGHVSYIIEEQLAVIVTDQNVPPLNLDSCLFLENRKLLGKVYEIFGPVKLPYYVVGMQKGSAKCKDKVYYTSETPEYFQYALTNKLMKMKGSDASWFGDVEPPEHCLDYSDDEQERQARRDRKEARKAQGAASGEGTNPASNSGGNNSNKRRYGENRPQSWHNRSQVYKNNTASFNQCEEGWVNALSNMSNRRPRNANNQQQRRPAYPSPFMIPPPPPSHAPNQHGGMVGAPTAALLHPPMFNHSPMPVSQSLFNPNIPPPPPIGQLFYNGGSAANTRSSDNSAFSNCVDPPPPPPPGS